MLGVTEIPTPSTLHLDIDASPLPNRTSLITDDLLHTEYVGDSGFIIDSFSNVRNSVELQTEEGNSASIADITGVGAQEPVLEYPIDDTMDTSVSEDEIYIRRHCESDFPSTKNRYLYD